MFALFHDMLNIFSTSTDHIHLLNNVWWYDIDVQIYNERWFSWTLIILMLSTTTSTSKYKYIVDIELPIINPKWWWNCVLIFLFELSELKFNFTLIPSMDILKLIISLVYFSLLKYISCCQRVLLWRLCVHLSKQRKRMKRYRGFKRKHTHICELFWYLIMTIPKLVKIHNSCLRVWKKQRK